MLLNFFLGLFYISLLGLALLLIYRGGALLVSGGRRRRPRNFLKQEPPLADFTDQITLSQGDDSLIHPDQESLKSEEANSTSDSGGEIKPLSEEDMKKQGEVLSEASGRDFDAEAEGRYQLKNEDDLSPQKIIPLLRRVEILIARKEYDEAKKILIRLLSLEEDHVEASTHLAYIFLQSGEYVKAENLFRKILESRSNNPSLLTNFALSILEQNNHSQIADAVEALRFAVNLDSKNAERYSNLGQALYLAGDPNGAVESFESAIRYAPRNIEYLFFLADSYMAIQNYPYAKRIFSRILEISPLNEEAKRELYELSKLGD